MRFLSYIGHASADVAVDSWMLDNTSISDSGRLSVGLTPANQSE